jgi:hypothetical protein
MLIPMTRMMSYVSDLDLMNETIVEVAKSLERNNP